ncbi:MAG TPA: fibronectin type III domain-containing protein, partial [Patescibacteria group bacterium]|nr:fibronectin type III domain-containing protein [Patescibacteria group bacterium]
MSKLSDVLSKRIPTILGIIFLVSGLGVGIFIVNQGTGGFLPKASPETTPKNVKITNISDNAFSVSFITDTATPGYIKYGTEADKLQSQTSDDRDQLSGAVGQFTTHHITLRSLSPATPYYFAIGT